jgi:formylglycine-generating enzyme required for sulfatase activity
MRVFLASTPAELALHRAAAQRVVRDLGWEAVDRETLAPGGGTIEAALRGVDEAGLVLAIVGWGRGPVPAPEMGGDGFRPWAQWEVSRAFQRGRPAVVLMASDAWPAREDSPDGSSVVADFRAELAPLAVPFDPEPGGVAQFEKLLRTELEGRSMTSSRSLASLTGQPSSISSARLSLRVWPRQELPGQPWPVLLPYSHPDLLAGRDRELAELTDLLDLPLPILGLHAASGSGKSSLLLGGLVPRLRSSGRAVVLDRHPGEPGLAARLIGDLLDGPEDALAVGDADYQTFVARLLTARRRAGDRAPILVLDQFEDVLRGGRAVRAAVGTLLAATAQRRPGVAGPLCRWLLAYRREFHGPLVHWLADPLREARALGIAGVEDLPHGLASLDRFHAWPLPPFGSAPAGASDPAAVATEAFLVAITTPLALVDDAGAPRYPWRFEGDGAERLGRAFGEARVQQPAVPLVPELQVVLAHLVEAAGEPSGPEAPAVLVVPGDPGRLIDDALEEHLGRALDAAFPASDRIGRTRALLALRELADDEGRRAGGRAGDDLARAIGREGRDVLERMQAPQCRLVVAQRRGDDLVYALSHDRLAEIVVHAAEGGPGGGRLALEPGLLSLYRFVALQTDLFRSGDREQATQVSARNASGIQAHAETLLADDERRLWWRACQERRRTDRRRSTVLLSIAAAVVVLAGWATWAHVARKAAREALLQQVASDEPEAALAAFVRGLHDPDFPAEALRDRLRRRKAPLDVLESGMGGVPDVRRGEAVLEVAELAMPLLAEAQKDEVRFASLLWALDYGPGRVPVLATRAAQLRDRALAPLRRLQPPPPPGGAGWVDIPAGTFRMGEEPVHDVTVSAFRILDHETTNAEYRRLHPGNPGEDEMAVAGVSWYSAYVYSAWLGGRLPTEAEWEYAAGAGCRSQRCGRDGKEAAVNQVAWTIANSLDKAGRARAQPARRLEPNEWGLYDMLGGVYEWGADWYAPYDPPNAWGATRGRLRVTRGGSFRDRVTFARLACRSKGVPALVGEDLGFRPVLPAARHSEP